MSLQSYNDFDVDDFGVQYLRHISGSNAHDIRRRLVDQRSGADKGILNNSLVILHSVYNARVENGFMGLQRFRSFEKDPAGKLHKYILVGVSPETELFHTLMCMSQDEAYDQEVLARINLDDVLDRVLVQYEDGRVIDISFLGMSEVVGNRETCEYDLCIANSSIIDVRYDRNEKGYLLAMHRIGGPTMPRLFAITGGEFINKMGGL